MERIQGCRLSCATNAAACYLKLGDLDDCLLACKEALCLDGKCAKALFRKAAVLRQRGDFQEAEKTLRQAMESQPDDESLQRELAAVLRLQKQETQKAQAIAKKMFA